MLFNRLVKNLLLSKNLVVTITKNGLIYPLETEQFVTQSRGGKGKNQTC